MSIKYVDSNVFIYAIVADENSEPKASSSKKILKHIADGSLDAATSTLTWDEIVWSVRKLIGTETAIKHGKYFLDFPNLRLLRVDNARPDQDHPHDGNAHQRNRATILIPGS